MTTEVEQPEQDETLARIEALRNTGPYGEWHPLLDHLEDVFTRHAPCCSRDNALCQTCSLGRKTWTKHPCPEYASAFTLLNRLYGVDADKGRW